MELLLVAAAFGVLAAMVARKKNRDGGAWLLIGLLTGPFGLIASFIVDPLPAEVRSSNAKSKHQAVWDAYDEREREEAEAARRQAESQARGVTQTPYVSIADELQKLADLKDRGILTDDEFQLQKAAVLSR